MHEFILLYYIIFILYARVDIIRSSTPSNIWFHVSSSSSNPADISTHSSSLIHLDLSHWFIGPFFLSQNPIFRPSKDIFLQSEGKDMEGKIEMVVTNTVGSRSLIAIGMPH